MISFQTFPPLLSSMNRPIRTAFLLGTLLLAGCAMLSSPPEAAPSSPATSARAYHETISLGGRMSVRYQQNGQDEALHGGFTWHQQSQRTSILLRSPTGQTLAAIDVTPTSSTLTQAGRPPREAADIDQLAAQTLGWPLPVSGLRDWLQGFGTAQDGSRFVAVPGRDNSFVTQDGWQLRYDSWQPLTEAGSGARPRRIDLERMTEQAGPVSLRIVIDDWQPPS